ncbi:unnamed protein product [Timema podura]|uniref:Uncharacterized protein n=1 Tax=Timema podura TaxID=61482 RepID=A0ABN7NQ63_TIMPD|nr:unnamed protein product [Timema podura]
MEEKNKAFRRNFKNLNEKTEEVYRENTEVCGTGSQKVLDAKIDRDAGKGCGRCLFIVLQPATHFLLASLYSTKGNFSGAAHHLKQVLRVDPDFISEGLAEHLLLVMSCREKFSHHLSRLDTEETCGASIPATASSITNKQWTIATGIENLKEGETLICSPDGEQCRSVQCFSVNPDSTSAKILALKSLAQEQCGGIPLLQTNQDELHDETELEQMVDEMEEEEVGSLLEMNKLLDQITMCHNESVIDINGKQNPLATVLFHNETRICMATFTVFI